MTHKIAKLLLEHAKTPAQRDQAVRSAIFMGMPPREIEEYLDWLDVANPPSNNGDTPPEDPAPSPR